MKNLAKAPGVMPLKSQIEAIADNSSEKILDVIIHLQMRDNIDTDTSNATIRAMKNRNMVSRNEDLLPVSRTTIEKLPPGKVNAKFNDKPTLSAQIARVYSLDDNGLNKKMDAHLQRLNDFLHSATLSRSIGRVYSNDGKTSRYKPKRLWASDSVRVSIKRDDLTKILDLGESVIGVFANSPIDPPKYSRSNTSSKEHIGSSIATWGLEKVGAISAWGGFGARGKGVKVAVLDTGVDINHPDLVGRVRKFAEFTREGHEIPNAMPRDTDGHGTHVAGTIVGSRNSGRHIGIAPESDLYVGLVLDGKQGGTDAQVLAGLNWAIRQKVDVINLSLGNLSINPIVETVYQVTLMRAFQAGIIVVAAIGNDGSQMTGAPGNDFFSFAVGAVDSKDRVAGFSGGRSHVITSSPVFSNQELPIVYSKPDISAPGVAISSCVPGGKWDILNGTSMATPHVSGSIAALLSVCDMSGLTQPQKASIVPDLFLGSAMDIGEAGQDHRYGFGRLDLYKAIDQAYVLGYGHALGGVVS